MSQMTLRGGGDTVNPDAAEVTLVVDNRAKSCGRQSAVSPQQIRMPSMPPNPTNTAELPLFARPNTTTSLKRAGVVVRNEEVVGSNPATPTRKAC